MKFKIGDKVSYVYAGDTYVGKIRILEEGSVWLGVEFGCDFTDGHDLDGLLQHNDRGHWVSQDNSNFISRKPNIFMIYKEGERRYFTQVHLI